MTNNTIYIILGILVVVYFGVQGFTKKRWKARKTKTFLEGRGERKKEKDRQDGT